MKIKELKESATTAGAIAPGVPATIGKTQKRAGSLFQGKVTNKPFYEQEESETEKKKPKKDFGKMFQKKVDQSNKAKKDTEEKVKAHTVKEDEIVEQDLILVPGQIKGKDKSFIPHEKDRRDHEVEMARSELFAAAKDAQRIYAMLKSRTEDEGLMGWQQSYITLAADYLNSVADSLDHQAHTNEMTGGVLAGGMSNFEESKDKPSPDAEKLEKLKKLLYRNRSNTKEFGKEASLTTKELDLIKNEIKRLTTKSKEVQVDEEKDACYNKVKSRYKVWPSAYASGALVKCRKVGASNWGNKSKK